MTKSLSKGYDPTGETSSTYLPIPGIKWNDEFRVKSNSPDEAVLVNITSPIDRVEKMRFNYNEIADVYKNTGIDISAYNTSTKGVSILSQVTDIWSVTDSVDPTYRIDLPVSAHLVIKIPSSDMISVDDIVGLVGRMVAGLYTGDADGWRINSMMKGTLVPKGL